MEREPVDAGDSGSGFGGKRTSAALLLFKKDALVLELKSGQVMCYKTGQVYLLLTISSFILTFFLTAYIISHVRKSTPIQ